MDHPLKPWNILKAAFVSSLLMSAAFSFLSHRAKFEGNRVTESWRQLQTFQYKFADITRNNNGYNSGY